MLGASTNSLRYGGYCSLNYRCFASFLSPKARLDRGDCMSQRVDEGGIGSFLGTLSSGCVIARVRTWKWRYAEVTLRGLIR